MPPETKYAKSGDVHIAYQVLGTGPIDLICTPGWLTHLEYSWEHPLPAHFYRRLASFARLVLFDKRGTGMSDRSSGVPSLEARMDDIRAVMDAVGIERAALLGISEGASMNMLFAATHPERTAALVTIGAFAKRVWSPDYPWAPTPAQRQQFLDAIEQDWGGVVDLASLAPSAAQDESFSRWFATYLRLSASPGAALALAHMNTVIDIRHVLPSIRVPTLIIHRTGDLDSNIEEGRWIAGQIPNARFVELPGNDHLPYAGDADAILNEIEEFLTGARPEPEPDRVLATVLFTDIVGSTERAASLGDRRWRELLDSHHASVRRELARFRGREVATTGDGFLATFDGPARGIRCALAAGDSLQPLGIAIRAGLHTGEIELMGDNVGGIAVHIAARVAALAETKETLVSSTVKDLVAGSGIQFADRGAHVLKGVPGEWHLFAVER
jgi:pimeloyl-ACP methyl ester carboxylesterase